jgi:hypothetical protein
MDWRETYQRLRFGASDSQTHVAAYSKLQAQYQVVRNALKNC